ncbi:hypothetical protein C484_05272 [Natrialba taiwanensis DSM 12281]|uniref:Uncharacterized protein n=1 Tax=Natrialba taiwanensis DSM 12281 TaxID=1230458 RepID=M0ABK5_9EURY|nr:hypothetical protein C484_05272 [Natrialba taiwanensis DSM 12281]
MWLAEATAGSTSTTSGGARQPQGAATAVVGPRIVTVTTAWPQSGQSGNEGPVGSSIDFGFSSLIVASGGQSRW